jgi:hypothetical protein
MSLLEYIFADVGSFCEPMHVQLTAHVLRLQLCGEPAANPPINCDTYTPKCSKEPHYIHVPVIN